MIQGWYSEEKLDAYLSWGVRGQTLQKRGELCQIFQPTRLQDFLSELTQGVVSEDLSSLVFTLMSYQQ